MREMKNSGIEWVGVVPSAWNIQRGKNILDILERPVLETDEVITCFRDGEVTLRSKRREEGFTFSLQEAGYQGIEPGDLVVHGMDGFAGAIGISDSRGKATPVLNVMDSSENKRYLMYYLRCAAYCGLFFSLATGIRVRSCDTNWNKLKNVLYLVPPTDEQQRIVSFLDAECSRIDSVIDQTRASIEEYKKLKQSVITQAVTKGIRPNRKMKDSGIEWIGEIPEEWVTPKIGSICSTITDYVASGSFASLAENVQYLDEPDYAMLIRTADVSQKGHAPKPVYINKHAYDFLNNSNLFGGELMLPNIGASVGDIYIVPVLYERMSLAPNAIMMKTIYNDKYFYYYFLSKPGRLSIEDIAQSTAQAKFNKTDFRQLRVLLPSENEQKEIVEYCDEKTASLDALIKNKENIITELESYKKSLIYEYVTGKKEVV